MTILECLSLKPEEKKENIVQKGWWLLKYNPQYLRYDLIAGLTCASVFMPQAMAHAMIARVPLQMGLYTVFIALLVYALMGSSRPLIVSTTCTISIMTAAVFAATGTGTTPAEVMGRVSVIALLMGIFLILAGFLKLGFLADFISLPVLTGFKAGIGFVVIGSQIPNALGIQGDKTFFTNLHAIFDNISHLHHLTLLIAIVTLGTLILLPRLSKKIPAPLIAVILAVICSGIFDFKGCGVQIVGDIPKGLPVFTFPDFSELLKHVPAAMGIALMSFTESIAAGRTFTKEHEEPPDANREMFALGLSNIAGSLFKGMPCGGGTTQTALSEKMNPRSPMSKLVTVAGIALILLFLTPFLAFLPQATLAALVIYVASHMIQPEVFSAIKKVRKREFRWAMIAFFGVITMGTLKGIIVAIIVSMLTIINEANHPPLYVLGRKKGTNIFRPIENYPDDETFPGLLMIKSEGLMYFASVPNLTNKIRKAVDDYLPEVLLMDFSAVCNIEYSALDQLMKYEKKMKNKGITLWLTALNPKVMEAVKSSPLWETLGEDRMFVSNELAVEAFEKRHKEEQN